MTHAAKLLCITFCSGTRLPKYDWQTKKAKLAHQPDKLWKMTGLSTFAKYYLFNKFIISQILYAAEVIDITEHIEDSIQQLAKYLLPPGSGTNMLDEGRSAKQS